MMLKKSNKSKSNQTRSAKLQINQITQSIKEVKEGAVVEGVVSHRTQGNQVGGIYVRAPRLGARLLRSGHVAKKIRHSQSPLRAPPRASASSQADARLSTLLSTFAPSGPTPPHVPNAAAMKCHPSAEQGTSYLRCLSCSLRRRNSLQLS